MRVISDRQSMQLKAATRRAIDMAGGSDTFEHVTRVRQGQLSKYGLAGEDHAACFAPIDVALEADIEAGSPIITEMMAKLQGYRLVREGLGQSLWIGVGGDIAALTQWRTWRCAGAAVCREAGSVLQTI